MDNMAKSANQKLKLLYLRQFLLEKSDEEHPVSVAEMIDHLAAQGVSAERKSIYDDLEALRLFGMDILQVKGKHTGYYVGERDFELPELKLLVDSVQSSKFITHKKTLSLIGKIENLASSHDAKLLQRQVYVRGRVKSMNESVYYTVDEISAAITADRAIRFRYFEYTVSKEQRFRRDGAFYTVSPFALLWDDENYYLLGYDHDKSELRHYRVDKMKDIAQTGEARQGKDLFADVDMSAYSQKVFGMFSGREQLVKLRFREHLVGTVIDRFGKDVMIIADGQGFFTVTLSLVVSPQFFGWLFGYGDEVEVLAPENLRCEVKDLASKVAAMYE